MLHLRAATFLLERPLQQLFCSLNQREEAQAAPRGAGVGGGCSSRCISVQSMCRIVYSVLITWFDILSKQLLQITQDGGSC